MNNNNLHRQRTSNQILSGSIRNKKVGDIRREVEERRKRRQEQHRLVSQEKINTAVIDGLVNIFKKESEKYQGKYCSKWTLGIRIGGYRTYLLLTIILAIVVFVVSVLYFLYIIGIDIRILPHNDIGTSWNDRINFLPVYFTLLFILYFVAKQYSYYRNLYVDMYHRYILARSYKALLEDDSDRYDLKAQMVKKIVDFIASPPHTKEEKTGDNPLEVIANIINQDRKQ